MFLVGEGLPIAYDVDETDLEAVTQPIANLNTDAQEWDEYGLARSAWDRQVNAAYDLVDAIEDELHAETYWHREDCPRCAIRG